MSVSGIDKRFIAVLSEHAFIENELSSTFVISNNLERELSSANSHISFPTICGVLNKYDTRSFIVGQADVKIGTQLLEYDFKKWNRLGGPFWTWTADKAHPDLHYRLYVLNGALIMQLNGTVVAVIRDIHAKCFLHPDLGVKQRAEMILENDPVPIDQSIWSD